MDPNGCKMFEVKSETLSVHGSDLRIIHIDADIVPIGALQASDFPSDGLHERIRPKHGQTVASEPSSC